LEISRTGVLPYGLTVADLTRNHQSLPRNALLANIFYLRDLTERQRRILHMLGDGATLRSGEIRAELSPMPSATVLRDELSLLRSLGLIEGSGHGAGARWWLKPQHRRIERNRTTQARGGCKKIG
jgi:hypothetical protein